MVKSDRVQSILILTPLLFFPPDCFFSGTHARARQKGGVPCNVIREISLLRELDHPNVVKLYDIIQAHPGGLYLVFEYVAHDLKTYMDQFQTSDDIADRVGLPLPTVRSFLKQIIAGVGTF